MRRLGIAGIFLALPVFINSFSFSHPGSPPFVAPQIQQIDSTRPPVPAKISVDSLRRDSTYRRHVYESLRITRDSLGVLRDSLGFMIDTTKLFAELSGAQVDTTWVVYLDSTVRLQQFVYKRTDQPAVQIFPRNKPSYFLDTRSQAYTREISLDSTGQFVTVREKVNGVDVKVPVTITLDQYIHERYEEEKLNNWRTFTREYTVKGGQDELGGLLSNFTNIDIPVPANPILSIFGKPVINIHTSGQIDIRAGFRSVKSDQTSLNVIDVSRNEPDFNQQVQINVSGTVGDKLNILADWNTQRTFEYENSLKIKYTGYEDEIVQSVEAGNVSLQTPSLVGGGQALFGLKTRLQFGPLSVTALLSQKKGETKEITASGGQQSQTQDIRPQAYSTYYYFVDTVYRQYWGPLHESISPALTPDMLDNQIIQLDLWMSVPASSQNVSKIFKARAYTDLPSRAPSEDYPADVEKGLAPNPGEKYEGNFIQLEPGKDYKFRFEDPRQVNGGYIVLNTSIPDEQALAVTYTVLGHGHPRAFGTKNQTYNKTTADTVYLLKLIKPPGLVSNPGYRTAWNLQLKNVYPLGGRDLKPEGFSFQMYRQTEASDVDQINGENLLRVLGLDRFNATNESKPDNLFDFIPGLTIDIERAELIFPTLRPFDSTISQYFKSIDKPLTSDSLLFGDIYDTTYTAATNNTLKNKYLLRVQASTGTSSKYQLGFNVVEGSVHVILDGTELQQNTDYTVDYIIGEVNIKRPEASLPGHSVQVKFEQNDLFQLASKTLMGARAELNLFPNTNLGFTAMNLNQATLSDKVRIGEEPTNNLILGTDLSTSMNLPILTNLIDALPFIRTREMSTLRFSGEGAYSLPDPNTKKSTLTGDNSASIAYIDDFEGARQTVSIDIAFANWRLASPPIYTLLNGAIDDTTVSYSRARLWWYNNPQGFENVLVTDIWPYRSVQRGQEYVYPLYLEYNPLHRGMYNYSPKLDSTLNRHDEVKRAQNWNGVMRYVGTYAGSLLDKNITFLEVWAQLYDHRTNTRPTDVDNIRHGKLFIDLGRISEDVIPNKELNSEDIIVTVNNPHGITRGVADEENDRGLDLVFDTEEQTAYADFLNSNKGPQWVTPSNPEGLDPDIDPHDPSGDDYFYKSQTIDFSRINGMEGNMNIRRDPDTEDLNRNGNIDPENEYLEYDIPLDSVYYDTLQNLVPNPYIVGGNKATGWYQLRIPLIDPNRVIGGLSAEAVLSNVKYMRMWLSGFKDSVTVRIAEINLVGNQWLQSIARDSILALSVVNLEDNPEYNTPDYQNLGIVRERDKTQPDQNILANEQSLSLILNGLPPDSTREIYKTFPVRPLDIFNYKQVKMFVHGDPTFIPYSESSHTAEVYLRFGSDSLNYYEYRQPVWRDWDPHNELKIPLDALTAVKSARDSVNVVYHFPADNGISGATYGIRGSPSLRRVQYIGIGVHNTGAPGTQPIHGQVWVNELRLIDVNNTAGYAYHFETQVKLADLGTASFNYSRTDPNFHALDARFGDQLDHRNWAVNANIELARFLPESWAGSQISTSVSHGESMVLPRYLPNTDVVVAEAARVAEEKKLASPSGTGGGADSVNTVSQTMQVSDSYSLSSFHLAPPSQFFLIREILARITLGFNYNKSRYRDPVTEVRSLWSWNSSASYGLSLGSEGFFQPFKSLFSWIPLLKEYKDWKIYYQPFQSFQARIGAQRSRQYEQSRLVDSPPRDTRNFGVSKSIGFQWKLTEGGLTGIAGDYGLTMDRNLNDLDNDSVGRDFSSLLHSIFFGGQDNRYSQRVTFNLKPNLPNIFNIKQYFDLTAAYGVNYGWQNTFQRGDIGKGAGFDNNISFGTNIKLKSIFDPLFEQSAETPNPADTSKGKTGRKKSILNMIKTIGTIFIKVPFLDFENIAIQFSEQNRAASNGVVGSTGFLNFWGRLPFQEPVLAWGPTRMYQLGIITDPSGTLHYAPTSHFPFLGWDTERGLRAPDAQLNDQFNQSNNFTIRTTRSLWEGASLEINWKVGWQNSKQTSFLTDDLGLRIDTSTTFTTAGSVERSYLTIPPVFFFKVFNSSLENVGKKYDALIVAQVPPAEAASQAFEQGLEALPFMTKIFGQFWPRANWTIHWDGIEKIGGISSVVDHLSLEHAYTSTFRKDFVGTVDGSQVTNSDRTIYGFAPLLGLTATFKEVWKGSLQGTARFNTSTAYDLTVSTQQIAETFTQEVSLSFTYQRRGFNLPLFGLNLKNDVEFNLTFSEAKNSRTNYGLRDLSQNQDGSPLDGNTRTTLEPRIKYNLSSQVSASLFYRYTRIAPDQSGSTVYGTTTNEAGIDAHIAIR